jgi:hypothetical protein
MESEFPGNSITSRGGSTPPKEEGEKKVEKIVAGRVVRRKKPFHKRITEKFTGGEDAASVFDYVIFEILVPAAKDLFLDATYAGLERKFYGEVRSAGRRGYSRGLGAGTRVDYNRISTGSTLRNDPRTGPVDPRMSRRARSMHDFDEIVLESRMEANAIIDQMFELLSRYEIVTVADLYEMLGEKPGFQDYKFGWDDLRGSDSERVRDGYILVLPRPKPIE